MEHVAGRCGGGGGGRGEGSEGSAGPDAAAGEEWAAVVAPAGMAALRRAVTACEAAAQGGPHGEAQLLQDLPIPSVGSMAHGFNSCLPCHYVHARIGCFMGAQCGLCHYKHSGKRRPKVEVPATRGSPEGDSACQDADSGGSTHAAEGLGRVGAIDPAGVAALACAVAACKTATRGGPPAEPAALSGLPIPSVGSMAHGFNSCLPCRYVNTRTGCFMGAQCGLCHYRHQRGKRRPKAVPPADFPGAAEEAAGGKAPGALPESGEEHAFARAYSSCASSCRAR